MTSIEQLGRKVLPRRVVSALGSSWRRTRRWSQAKKLDSAVARFTDAYTQYWRDGTVPSDAEDILFMAAWASGGVAPAAAARVHGRPFDRDRYAAFPDEILRDVDAAAVARGVLEDGFYVAPQLLQSDVLDAITDVVDRGPAVPRGDGLGRLDPGPPSPSAPTWWVAADRSVECDAVRRLLSERRLADLAGLYLGVDPMIMSIALWKSYAWREADKLSAQYFHYDNDRPVFIKMFVYLTDVAEENGPHVYVRGSHREKPTALLHGGRLDDADVARAFPRDAWTTITGPRGSLFFADTRGLHKGAAVTAGERAMFQINLASDRFGAHLPAIALASEAPADLQPLIDAAPRYFSQLFTPATAIP